MDTESGKEGNMVESDEVPERASGRDEAMAALQQCELIQDMIEISISSLQGLRTKCAASNDLTQQEIRTLEVKLVKYICKQLLCKQKVPASERSQALDSYPRLRDWLRTINLRSEVIQAVPVKLSLDALLQMSSSQVRETMKRLGSSSEECSRLSAALSCLKRASESGGELKEDLGPWISEPTRRDSSTTPPTEQLPCPGGHLRPHSPSPLARPPCTAPGPGAQPRSISASAVPSSDCLAHPLFADGLGDPFPPSPRPGRSGLASTPPVTPPSKRKSRLKPPRTPPPPSRKVLHLLPTITTLTRSKSHESQLGNRIDDAPTSKTPMSSRSPKTYWCGKKSKLFLNVHMNGSGNSSEDSPSRSPLISARTPGASPAAFGLPGTPTLLEEHIIKNNVAVHRGSPQAVRRDIGLAITHRFSTKSWLSQTCQVCQRNMMFGVKCKHCKLKCHNKCTKEAPSCRISFLPSECCRLSPPLLSLEHAGDYDIGVSSESSCRLLSRCFAVAKIRRTESVPSDINNPVDRPAEAPQFGTLPKAITKKDHAPVLNQLDSSSNPSSTTSSTPSSPAPFQQSNPPSATPPPNPSPKGPRDSRFNFPAACYFQHRQQFIFPDVPSSPQPVILHPEGIQDNVEMDPTAKEDSESQRSGEQDAGENKEAEEEEGEEEEEEEEGEGDEEGGGKGGSDGEYEADELDDLPSQWSHWKGPISRKASQTSVYLQEWDIPYEQLELGELIGKGRWGKVHKGRWHGEVAVRLLEIDGNNQDHLKLFKKEVMNYRQTRHENVVLFMGACMNPPHLAIITSFCKGRTLYSVVRDAKNTLDINKTRQIAQEIVKGMGYLHAKGIVHKDLKSKNVFYDSNKVVITDFGLFGMSGVVQEGRRENELKVPHGWICYLAPEIVRRMSPGGDEDRLPFSNAADVYAFGTIWYELQARDWPIKSQPVEATIWQVGSGEGIRKVLSEISLGKEVTEILSACWSYELRERPTFTLLADMLEKLPKLNRRLSHPGHFWKSAEYVS
ncbi:kinase suppressor of Ras 1 isoform X3 [Lepisosteus oculatus]|uniref:kinase suppressor of Ras 1 isoform X3 n=1 Tax=Lepisosteus oculatus TaxID=7918 RepID=UPI0037206CEE